MGKDLESLVGLAWLTQIARGPETHGSVQVKLKKKETVDGESVQQKIDKPYKVIPPEFSLLHLMQ
ncbi:hypothetical protein GCM10023156_37440 [Novipirellula rosea]|uniref:Uncharacterized protein n=1 Tax=Novipirellula rosea TaxID=1031540 RepID=A0ABP8N1C5_9BACT